MSHTESIHTCQVVLTEYGEQVPCPVRKIRVEDAGEIISGQCPYVEKGGQRNPQKIRGRTVTCLLKGELL